jgi:hypothetical protein
MTDMANLASGLLRETGSSFTPPAFEREPAAPTLSPRGAGASYRCVMRPDRDHRFDPGSSFTAVTL